MKKVFFFFSVLFVITFWGCSDDDASKSATEILTNGKWYTESIESESTINGKTTKRSLLEDCSKDDYSEFKSNGTIVNVFGPDKCDSGESNMSGTWNLSDGDKKLSIKFSDDDIVNVYTIISISETKITLTEESSETTDLGVISYKTTIVAVNK